MTKAPRWIVSLVALLTTAAIAGGCGDARRGGVDEDQTNGVTQGAGRCSQEGITSACTIEIARSGGVISCAKGLRTCRGGSWGACAAETTSAAHYTVPTPTPQVSDAAGSGQVHGLSISSSSTNCTDNPCDPYCKIYPDTPDAALTGDSSTVVTYSESNLTFDTLPNGNPPSGFVKKGNDYTNTCGSCYPALPSPYAGAQACYEACQFDSHCKGNGQNECVMFTSGLKDYCPGIDVTTPIVCTIPGGADVGKRRVRMCNRGGTAIPINSAVECWQFPGGSPKYPESDPVANTNGGEILDTFNEAVPAGECITHLLDSSAFHSNGTESIMCNIRQASSSLVTLPSAGVLPTNATTASSVLSGGAWANTARALDTAGNNFSSVSLVAANAATPAAGPSLPATAAGWTNITSIGASADGASATTLVGSAANPTATASSAVASSGAWTNPINALGANNTTIATATVANTPVVGFAGASAVGVSGVWTNLAAAQGTPNGAYASQTFIKGTNGGIWLSGSAAGASLPDAAVVTSLSATVHWRSANVKMVGAIDLYKSGAALSTNAAAPVGVPTPAPGTDATFTFTAAQLAGVTGADIKAANSFKVYLENTSNSTSYLAEVDGITINATYSAGGSTVLRFANFGLGTVVPSNATITSVSVAARVGSSAAVGVGGTITANVYKNARATLVVTGATTRTTAVLPGTALADLVVAPAGLTGSDLTDANFAVDVAVTAGSTSNFTVNVDAVTVTVNYSTPTTQTVSLAGFGLQALVPAGSTINSITTNVGWAINASNIKATLTAQPTLAGAALGPVITKLNPATAITTYGPSTYTNAGAVTWADLANFGVDLTAALGAGGAAFTASVDWVGVTVNYAVAGATSSITLGGYGYVVPATSTNVSVTMQSRWYASDTSMRLCFQAYDGATPLGSANCTTAGAAPTSATSLTSPSTAISVANANNLSIQVTATGGAVAGTAYLDSVVAQLQYTSNTLTGVNECNIHNNWSVAKTNPAIYCPATSVTTYFDFTKTRVFDGVCPTGTRTRWRLFGWDSSAPNTTKIEFRFRAFEPTTVAGVTSCVALPGTFTGAAPAALATAQSTPTDTQVCSLTAPPSAACPADLTTYLGNPTSDLRCMQMDAHGYADTLGAPTLTSWNATYDCLPSE